MLLEYVMDNARSTDTCYSLERSAVNALAARWCARVSFSDISLDRLIRVGDTAYDYAVYMLCETSFVSPANAAKAMDFYAAAMLCEFVRYGLDYDELLNLTTLDCANYAVVLSPDMRLASPRRKTELVSRLSHATKEVHAVHLARSRCLVDDIAEAFSTQATYCDGLPKPERKRQYSERRSQFRADVTTVADEVGVLHTLQRTRLFFQLKYLKEDISDLLSGLDSCDVQVGYRTWKVAADRRERVRVFK